MTILPSVEDQGTKLDEGAGCFDEKSKRISVYSTVLVGKKILN